MDWAIVREISQTVLAASGFLLALFLAVRQYILEKPRWKVAFYDFVLLCDKDKRARYLVMEATITNQSRNPYAILEYGLIVGPPYGESFPPARFAQLPNGDPVLMYPDGKNHLACRFRFAWLKTPLNFQPHEALSGHIPFPLPLVSSDLVHQLHYWLYLIPSDGAPVLVKVPPSDWRGIESSEAYPSGLADSPQTD